MPSLHLEPPRHCLSSMQRSPGSLRSKHSSAISNFVSFFFH
uniref:Bm13088 n=1 Tax=Brugia malayi TaxID=6279 RepID=A0A1I9G1W9_BRUMA|nr:Bm13088 [Brugia malayi]